MTRRGVTFARSLSRRAAMARLCLLGGLGLALAGCGAEFPAMMMGANALSLNTTGMNAPDIAMSVATQKECRLIHLKYGKDYCRDLMAEAMAEAMKPKETCFRSLGQIQCYRSEFDPFGTREDPVQ